MEQEPKNPEQSAEFNAAELETSPEASQGPERAQESEADRNQNVEAARAKVEAQSAAEKAEPAKESAPKRFTSGVDRKQAYAETMASVQRHLSAPSRAFSKVIHNDVVDKTSEAIGQTVLRPSVTLGATSTALLVGGFTYWLAKHYGYALSGTTLLLALVVGGVAGVAIEGIAKLFQRKK